MIRVAYPNDFHRDDFERLLTEAELAVRSGRNLVPSPESGIEQLIGVSGSDLPILLLDGVFDAAFTTADRVVECRARERRRSNAREFGAHVDLTFASSRRDQHLLWGFSGVADAGIPQEGSVFSWEDAIYELARGGLEFSPADSAPRTVLCATTHPDAARSLLEPLDVVADVRFYPDPWSVVQRASNYCGLGVWTDGAPPPPSLRLALAQPMSGVEPAFVINEVAMTARSKGPTLKRLQRSLTRFMAAASIVRLDCRADATAVQRLAAGNTAVRSLRIYDIAGEHTSPSELSAVELTVDRYAMNAIIDELQELGSTTVIARDIYRAQLVE